MGRSRGKILPVKKFGFGAPSCLFAWFLCAWYKPKPEMKKKSATIVVPSLLARTKGKASGNTNERCEATMSSWIAPLRLLVLSLGNVDVDMSESFSNVFYEAKIHQYSPYLYPDVNVLPSAEGDKGRGRGYPHG